MSFSGSSCTRAAVRYRVRQPLGIGGPSAHGARDSARRPSAERQRITSRRGGGQASRRRVVPTPDRPPAGATRCARRAPPRRTRERWKVPQSGGAARRLALARPSRPRADSHPFAPGRAPPPPASIPGASTSEHRFAVLHREAHLSRLYSVHFVDFVQARAIPGASPPSLIGQRWIVPDVAFAETTP